LDWKPEEVQELLNRTVVGGLVASQEVRGN
jgi:hypothetical protein